MAHVTVFTLVILSCCLTITRPAGATRSLECEQEAAGHPEQSVDEQVAFEMSPEAFEPWAFGTSPAPAGNTQQELYRAMESRADVFGRLYGLSEPHVRKLRLAGQGDVERYWDELQHVRQEFLRPRYGITSIDDMEDDRARLLANRELLLSPFSPCSLMWKTLMPMLPEGERRRIEQEQYEVARQRHLQIITRLCWMLRLERQDRIWEKRSWLPGDDEQRRLEEQLLARIPVPRASTSFDLYVAVLHLSRLPSEELIALDPGFQQLPFQRLLEHAKYLEPVLMRHGLIAPSDPE